MFKVLRSRATIYTAEPCQRQQQGCPRLRVVAYTFQTFQLKGPSPTSASIILLSLAKGNKDVQGCVLLPIHLPAFQCNSCQHLFEAMLTMVPSNVFMCRSWMMKNQHQESPWTCWARKCLKESSGGMTARHLQSASGRGSELMLNT
eukprot:scaffold49022_cov19-Tisochrysis_lutea.AAC.1